MLKIGNNLQKFARRKNAGRFPRWLLSYSDMMTLLFAFFVLIAAVSEVDRHRYDEIRESFASTMGGEEIKKPFQNIKSEFEKIARDNNLEKDVSVKLTTQGIKIEFASTAFYRSGDAEIMEDSKPMLENVALLLKKSDYDGYSISVEGHTDDVPIRSPKYPSNWELSVNRATNVVRFLIDKGVKKEFLKAAGFADIYPVVPNIGEDGKPSEENRKRNRRVSINISR